MLEHLSYTSDLASFEDIRIMFSGTTDVWNVCMKSEGIYSENDPYTSYSVTILHSIIRGLYINFVPHNKKKFNKIFENYISARYCSIKMIILASS